MAMDEEPHQRRPRQTNHILRYLVRHRWMYVAGFLMLVVATAAQQAVPFVLRFAIDAIADGTTRTALAGFAGIILALAALEGTLRYFSRNVVSGTARRIEYRLRNDLAEQLLNLDQGFYTRSRTGDLMARCTNDLEWIRNFTGPIVIDLARTTLMLVIGVGFLLAIDLRLGLIAIAYLPVVAGLVIYFERAVERRYQRVQEQFAVLTNRAQENMSGIRAVKAHALEETEIAAFRDENREMMGRAVALAFFTAALFLGMTFATGASTGLVLWFGGHDVVSGRITLGQFVQFGAVLAIMANQLSAVGWVVSGTQQGIVASRRVNEILNTVPAVQEPAHPRPARDVRGHIAFRGVEAAYAGRTVLRDVTFDVPAGSTVALVGLTGAGKTTLVNLLVRLQDPVAGAVLIDGIDTRAYSLEGLRGAIGVVPQESFLFSDSLRVNLCFGRESATEDELQQALETSQLINDLPQFPYGLDTVIGERGVTMSGGQKQRAALARALLKAPPILVLDDALSHVDTHTEEEILRRLRRFMRERTTILITHRTAAIRSADQVVVLHDGTVAEIGTHEELLARGGPYAAIYRQQLLAEQRLTEIEGAVVDAEVGDAAGGSA